MKIVLALGGNALGNNPKEQIEKIDLCTDYISDLVSKGNELVLVHGNGPQVGMIKNAFDISSKYDENISNMPFPECIAMSQGYIGYHLQNRILNKFLNKGINKNILTLVTQVEVDKDDPAFTNPTKPIGSFISKEEAVKMEKETGFKFVSDAGRGYRRVVASPRPKKILELESIKTLLDNGDLVITGGGGGIPVIKEEDEYIGVGAVIDKDLVASKIAQDLDCDTLIILTAVEQVAINFGKDNELWLDNLSIDDIDNYIEEEQFHKGSMLPKILAAKEFVLSGENKECIVTSIEGYIKGNYTVINKN